MSKTPKLEEISTVQKTRLKYIEFRAYFFGAVGRKDLVKKFGIAIAAATRDFTLYNKLAPKNLVYNPSRKQYEIGEQVKLLFEYSEELIFSILSEGFKAQLEARIVEMKNYSTIPKICRSIPRSLLATITRSIYLNQVVKIEYTSQSSGKTTREVIPHSLIDDDFQKHIRAFDRSRNKFLDFNVTRISSAQICEYNEVQEHEKQEYDTEWNQIVTLKVVPHPKEKHTETIEYDYGMANGELSVKIRAAEAGYFLRRWSIDSSINGILSQGAYHLHLKNAEELQDVSSLYIAPGHIPTNSK